MWLNFQTLFGAILFTLSNHHSECSLSCGCGFDVNDNSYHLTQNSVYDVQFGHDIATLALSSKRNVNRFYKKLKNYNEKVLKKYPLNDVEEFLSFYQEYERRRINEPKDFETFYDGYTPNYKEKTVDYSLVMENFKMLAAQYVKYPYLCTVYRNIQPDELNIIKEHFSREVPLFFQHGSVAGIIKFRTGIENTTGHMLVDPGSGLDKPIVLGYPDFLKDTAKMTFRQSTGLETKFSYLNGEQYYIVAENRINGNLITDLYFIHKPYCSILKTTAKIRLTKAARSMIRRRKNGMPLLSLSFAPAIQENGTIDRAYFLLATYQKDGWPDISKEILFENELSPEILEDRAFKTVSKGLEIVGADLKSKLESLSRMAHDNFFLSAIKSRMETYLKEIETYRDQEKNRKLTEIQRRAKAKLAQFDEDVFIKSAPIVACSA